MYLGNVASFVFPNSDATILLSCPTNRSFHRIQHVLIRRATYHQNTSRILFFREHLPLAHKRVADHELPEMSEIARV